MKRLIIILTAVVALAPRAANAQELYQYAKDSVITTSLGSIYVINKYSTSIRYSKAVPAYEPYEPSTCTDPTIKRNQYGEWILDKTRFGKISQSSILNIVRLFFAQYRTLLKSAFDGKGQIWITIRTGSTGVFKNAEVEIWAEPSVYRQIPPAVLCNLLNSIDDLQFTVPAEYQCISDHYFRYSVFFKDL